MTDGHFRSREVFCKKGVIISQNLQENTCVGVSFLIKLQAWGKTFPVATFVINNYYAMNYKFWYNAVTPA